jgi:hypothetical protein
VAAVKGKQGARTYGNYMKNVQTGTVSGVYGKHIYIENDKCAKIYAHRNALTFPDPYIGLAVTFEFHIKPEMRDPVAANVRRC